MSSPFFEAALCREWLESQEGVVRLPAGDADAFQIYSQWLYTRRLHTHPGSRRHIFVKIKEEWARLVRAYLLGEFLQDTVFRDSVIDAMQEWAQNCLSMSAYAYQQATEIYDKTSSASPLRHLVADLTAWRQTNAFLVDEQRLLLPPEFVWDLAKSLWARLVVSGSGLVVEEPVEKHRGTCYYHCHGLQPCYRGTHQL